MVEIRIKKYMDYIIDVAFKNETVNDRKRYKGYFLKILTREKANSSGMYRVKDHVIEVYNPRLGARHLTKCCLHELSHHIDWCKHGETGHQKPFYDVYRSLIYASLDMGILSREDFSDSWSSDGNKVKTIVSEYQPRRVEYYPDTSPLIRAYNAFDFKESLKEHGFRWNKMEQVWEKEEEEGDRSLLESTGIPPEDEKNRETKQPRYKIVIPDMHIDAVIYITATGNTYDRRECLKSHGFFYDKKSWKKKVKASVLKDTMDELEADKGLAGLSFRVMDRK